MCVCIYVCWGVLIKPGSLQTEWGGWWEGEYCQDEMDFRSVPMGLSGGLRAHTHTHPHTHTHTHTPHTHTHTHTPHTHTHTPHTHTHTPHTHTHTHTHTH